MKIIRIQTFANCAAFPKIEKPTGREAVLVNEVLLSECVGEYSPDVVSGLCHRTRSAILAAWPEWAPRREPIIRTYISEKGASHGR